MQMFEDDIQQLLRNLETLPQINIQRCVKAVLKIQFFKTFFISQNFRHVWPPRSPNLNSHDFWLWTNLKHLISRSTQEHLPTIKTVFHSTCSTGKIPGCEFRWWLNITVFMGNMFSCNQNFSR